MAKSKKTTAVEAATQTEPAVVDVVPPKPASKAAKAKPEMAVVAPLIPAPEDAAPADEGKGRKKLKKEKEKKKKKKKEAVVLRFEPNHLTLIDSRADALGLSRAAWVRMVVAQALAVD